MEFPDNLVYSREHEWVLAQEGVATIGITDFAQDELGDIVFVELPEVGAELGRNAAFGVAESVKTVSDLYCPAEGEVIEVNNSLEDNPEQVNNSPYDKGWMIKVKMADPSQLDDMMSAEDYAKYVKESK